MGKASTKAKNKYNAENYERISLSVPKGKKNEIKARADSLGLSINGYINRLIENELQGLKDAADMAQLIIEDACEEGLQANVSYQEYLQNVKRIIDRNRAEREERKNKKGE